jgi:hypothetical protein
LLRIQQTTCGCTSVKLGEVEWDPKHPAPKTIVTLDPGEKVDVELTWDTGERSGEFKTTANIESNDPKQHVIAFSVQGEIIPFVQLTQGQVRIDEVRNGTTTKAHTFVYSRKFDDLQLTDSSSSNPLITAKFEPVDDFFLQTMKAASGVKVEIIIQPGLPIGTFAASLTCRTNKEERPEVTIGISGQVQGAVLLTPSDNIDFKIVKTSESRTITLFVKIMGDEPVQVNVGNVRLARLDNTGNPQGTPVEEEVLKVDLQEMASSKNRWQLKVQVPQGSPGGKFKGVVEIETTHPTAKLVKIPVRFEVTK